VQRYELFFFETKKNFFYFYKGRKDVNDVIAGNDPQSPVRRFSLGDSYFRRNDGNHGELRSFFQSTLTLCALGVKVFAPLR